MFLSSIIFLAKNFVKFVTLAPSALNKSKSDYKIRGERLDNGAENEKNPDFGLRRSSVSDFPAFVARFRFRHETDGKGLGNF